MKDFGKCESTDMIKIGTKELRYPIVQGGMGIGISLGNLAGAVAKAGGAGTISAAQIGFKDPESESHGDTMAESAGNCTKWNHWI